MVIGAFPVFKLGALFVRQISKPLANIIKERAKNSPVFRKYVCMPPAQMYNWCEVKTKMWALNLGKPVKVPPLNEAMAIELGANLLGEFIIFAVGAGVLVLEFVRQSNNEYKKQEALKQEKAETTHAIMEMNFRIERQDAQLREITRMLADMESRSLFKWSKERIREFQPFDPNTPDQTPGIQAKKKKKNSKYTYDPDSSVLFRALNFLERSEIIGRRDKGKVWHPVEPLTEEELQDKLVENELAMLEYALHAEEDELDAGWSHSSHASAKRESVA